ncbi:hypothetical protein ACWGN5_11480 [Streptomyces sp. NPDC055815]
MVELVGAQAQLGVPGEEPEMVAVQGETRAEGLLRRVVVVVLVLDGVAERQPAVQVRMRAECVDALLRGPADGRRAAGEEKLLAAVAVGVERGHVVPLVHAPPCGVAQVSDVRLREVKTNLRENRMRRVSGEPYGRT